MKRNFIALKTPANNPPCQCEQGCSCIFTDLVTPPKKSTVYALKRKNAC